MPQELKRGCRQFLNLDARSLPDAKLHALWRTLDEDESGFVSTGEFGHFMKLGKKTAERRAALTKPVVINEMKARAEAYANWTRQLLDQGVKIASEVPSHALRRIEPKLSSLPFHPPSGPLIGPASPQIRLLIFPSRIIIVK